MWITGRMLTVVGLLCVASNAQPTTTVLFDNTGAEAGITVPGTTDFSFLGSNWTGGVVTTEFIPALYASGEFAYEIGPAGGAVTFDDPVGAVELFFVHNDVSFTPAARGGAPAVWVGAGRKMVFFGGMLPITGDTLEYDADQGAWRELSPELQGSVPGSRCHHTLVSDNANSNILMFGGFSFSGRFNDVWRFDPTLEQWTELDPRGVPPFRRCLHAAAYISSTDEMLVYGGVLGGGAAAKDYFSDTHIFDPSSGTWTFVTNSGPGLLRGAIAFYSTLRDAVYLWGGKQVSSFPTTLWRFDVGLGAWESVPTSGDIPVGREDPAYFWDDAQDMLILFSGRNDALAESLVSDLHILDLDSASWQELSTEGIPPARWRASVAFDPVNRAGYMFGGWRDFGGQDVFDDTWRYDVASMVWSPAQATGLSSGTATAFDSNDVPIASVSSKQATVFADPINFVTLNPAEPIARIEVTGGAIDSFTFGEAPQAIPAVSACGVGTMTLAMVAGGILLLGRRTNGCCVSRVSAGNGS